MQDAQEPDSVASVHAQLECMPLKDQIDEVAAEEGFKQRRELCRRWGVLLSLPKVYLYTLWSTCVHKPLRGD